MTNDPSRLGIVESVSGAEINVALHSSTVSGLMFVHGNPYYVAQVGSFIRIPIGLIDLIGIVSQAGATPDPPNDTGATGRLWMTVQLFGQGSHETGFIRGVSLLPSIGDSVHIMTDADLQTVYGTTISPDRIRIGHVASALSIPALLDINRLVTRHTAVVGATGAGKSTTVARVLESLTAIERYPSARILVFDVHGEYASTLRDRAQVFRVDSNEHSNSRPLNVPYWALSFDELRKLTFGDISDGASNAAVRDKITELKRQALDLSNLAGSSHEDMTVDTPLPFSVHQLWFDLHRTVNATHTQSGTGQSHETEALQLNDDGVPIQVGDPMAVLAPQYRPATQAAGQDKIYLSGSRLNIGRQLDALASRLRDRRYDFLFRPGPWTPTPDGRVEEDLDAFLKEWLGSEHTVSILDLSGVPSMILTDLVGALTRVIYDAIHWSRLLSEGGRERPLLFVFEEAHAYLGEHQPGSARAAVQRVVKEGRKYGMGAMIVSQRPSEIDSTILSQCGTIVALRLTSSSDRQHVTSAAPDNLGGLLSLLPALRTGEAIVLGEAVPLPMRAIVERPEHLPQSTDPEVVADGQPGGWDRKMEPADYEDVMMRWRSQDPISHRVVPSTTSES